MNKDISSTFCGNLPLQCDTIFVTYSRNWYQTVLFFAISVIKGIGWPRGVQSIPLSGEITYECLNICRVGLWTSGYIFQSKHVEGKLFPMSPFFFWYFYVCAEERQAVINCMWISQNEAYIFGGVAERRENVRPSNRIRWPENCNSNTKSTTI